MTTTPATPGVVCSVCNVFKLDNEFGQSGGKRRGRQCKPCRSERRVSRRVPEQTPHTVSWSEISAFRACPHKHQLSYIERWTQPQSDATALGRGSMWHLVLETHYNAVKDGRNHRDEVYDLLGGWRQSSRDPDVLDLMEWMYAGHLAKYGTDEQWEIIAVEYAFKFPLPNADGSPTRFTLKGMIDLVVRDRLNQRVIVVDHKSCGNLPRERELELDDQMGLYLWGLRSLGATDSV